MTQPHNQRPVYRIDLRPEANVDGIRALRAALKCLLRSYGLRCLRVVEAKPEAPAAAAATPGVPRAAGGPTP